MIFSTRTPNNKAVEAHLSTRKLWKLPLPDEYRSSRSLVAFSLKSWAFCTRERYLDCHYRFHPLIINSAFTENNSSCVQTYLRGLWKFEGLACFKEIADMLPAEGKIWSYPEIEEFRRSWRDEWIYELNHLYSPNSEKLVLDWIDADFCKKM